MNPVMNNIPCVVCGKTSSLMCQRCLEPYCNDVCQRKDWQRHKYFCTMMPPLVTLTALKPVTMADKREVAAKSPIRNIEMSPVPTYGVDSMTEAFRVADMTKTFDMNWREYVMPPVNEFFDCVVNHMEKDGSIWITDLANMERLDRLTSNMTRCLENKPPINLDDLQVGDLVGALVEKKMCRGQVLQVDMSLNFAELRLIDYGPIVTIMAPAIYYSVPHMAKYKAFAFRVMLATNTGVQLKKNLTLRLIGCKSTNGIDQVELKPRIVIPINLPVKVLETNPEVNLIRILKHDVDEPKIALVQIKKFFNINEKLNEKPGQLYKRGFPDDLSTFFVAAYTAQGYRRAFLLDYINEPAQYLVYEMDEGRISITNEVRRLPKELIDVYIRVFAITLAEGNTLPQSVKDLSIKFQSDMQGKNLTKLYSTVGTLLAQDKKVCAVRVNSFQGRIAELGHRFWRDSIENGSKVYITHVVSFQEICISSVNTKQYADIFKALDSKCLPFKQPDDIIVGSIVLVVCPTQGYYRGEVTSIDRSGYTVLNIDTGAENQVPMHCLRMPCSFLENLPVSQCRAKIKTICNIPASVMSSTTAAHNFLMTVWEGKADLQVEFEDSDSKILDLLDLTSKPASLMARMLPLIFGNASEELEVAESLAAAPTVPPEPIKEAAVMKMSSSLPALPPSPPHSPSKDSKANHRYYFENLKRKPIPLSKKIVILILNPQDLLECGYITACYFANETEAESFQNLLNLVAEQACIDDTLKAGYMPNVGEVCLTFYSEDMSWYRGVCLEIIGEKVRILYFDFGNSEVVSLYHVKPIRSDMLGAVFAVKCYIEGFDKSKDFSGLEKYLIVHNKIECDVLVGPERNTSIIRIPNLEQILDREIV